MPPRADAARPDAPTLTSRGVAVLAATIVVTILGVATWGSGVWVHDAEAGRRQAERRHRAAELAQATSALGATLRSVRLDAAMGVADDRNEDLAQAFDRTQRRLAAAAAGRRSDEALSGFDDLADAARSLSAAERFDDDDLAVASDAVAAALAQLGSDPTVGSTGIQTLDRLGRALDADTAAVVTGIRLLRSAPTERSAGAARVADARRRAQALLATAVPSLPRDARNRLDRIAEMDDADQLARELAALGDPVTAAETDSGADHLHDAAAHRGARLAAVERDLSEATADLAATAERRAAEQASTAVRARRVALAADALVLAAVALLAVGAARRRRSTATATANGNSRSAPGGRPDAPGPNATSATPTADLRGADGPASPTPSAPSVPGRGALADGLATLTRVVDRHQLLADLQLQVLDELVRCTGHGPAEAERRRALVGVADRLALRARRLDESLLVLAGVGRAQRPETSFRLRTLLEGAVVEAAAEHPVELDLDEDMVILGDAALDLAHVVAELVANAVEHGPATADQGVRVSARRGRDGLLRIVVRDPGALTPSELTALVVRVRDARPEAVSRALTDGRLGLATVAVLTARWECQVRFGRASDGSTEARLEVPARLVVGEGADATVDGPASTRQEEAVGTTDQSPNGGAWGWSSDGDYRPAEGWTANGEFVAAGAAVPDTLAGRLPEGADFDAGLASLLDRDEATTDA